mmetsp:Transcript_18773/g.58637  ORF Transcript_18773/g.58637 Transcript_18773/m.58637 type:complete len:380 (-) Transcript_18773:61-1200(-)
MGCIQSKPSVPTVESIIADVHSHKGATLDLSSAPATADAPAGKLKELDLALANGKVPDSAWACVSATSLSLKANGLPALSPKIAQLSNLRTLDVSENALSALPEGLGALEALETLDCSENHLEKLPDGLASLKKLRCVLAYVNGLKALPEGLGAGNALVELNVYNNKLTKLPVSLKDAAALERVNLGSNKLKTLPSLDQWTNVEELRVHQNALVSQFLPSFAALAALKLLKLERNLPLSRLPELGVHASLEVIECNNCSLEDLPDAAALATALPALEYLTVHQNRLKALPAFALPELATLNAGGNPVSALPSFAGCPKLRVLIVDDCDLATIDASFSPSTLPKLERLIVSGERLSDGAKTSVAAFADACKTNGGWVRGL